VRVIYADPGLRDNLGHHANTCRAIKAELIRRGIDVVVLAFANITEELKQELGALPLFRAYTYWQTDGDPIAGWLNCFDAGAQATVEDLGRLSGVTAEDIVYLNSAQPAQFMAIVKWLHGIPEAQRPHVVLEFGTDPGVDVREVDGQARLVLHDFRTDPRAMFYRFAAIKLNDTMLPRVHLTTFDTTASAIYAQMLGKPVGVLPLPQFAHAQIVSRVGRRPVTVSVLGHQRPDKGYHLMPEIARLLLALEPDARLLIHNGAPDVMSRVQQELRAHAAVEMRVQLNEQTADPTLWAALLAASDLILCPYEPARFVASYSAVAAEALASGIPLIVPGGTALARLLVEFGNPGAAFAQYTPASIVEATRAALAEFDTIAQRAVAAADQWRATMGAEQMVTALLGLCGRADPCWPVAEPAGSAPHPNAL
jgi:glycosyltransferase involved in cell wall biosynthesis